MPTATFNPVAGANSPVDGQVTNDRVASFATVRSGATGTSASPSESTAQFMGGYADASERQIQRAPFLFNLTGLPAGATISSATFSIYVTSVNNGANTWPGSNTYLALIKSSLASTANVTTSDFDLSHWDMSAKHATDLQWSSLTTNNQYYDWALNSTGITYLNSVIGTIASFGIVNGNDYDNVAYTNGTNFGFSCNFADAGSNKPQLVVTYSVPATGGGFFML